GICFQFVVATLGGQNMMTVSFKQLTFLLENDVLSARLLVRVVNQENSHLWRDLLRELAAIQPIDGWAVVSNICCPLESEVSLTTFDIRFRSIFTANSVRRIQFRRYSDFARRRKNSAQPRTVRNAIAEWPVIFPVKKERTIMMLRTARSSTARWFSDGIRDGVRKDRNRYHAIESRTMMSTAGPQIPISRKLSTRVWRTSVVPGMPTPERPTIPPPA